MKYIHIGTVKDFKCIKGVICCIYITNCPYRCKGCWKAYLQYNIGYELTNKTLDKIIDDYKPNVLCFMGGDQDPKQINEYAKYVKANYPDIKLQWFSGSVNLSPAIDINLFTYIKIGPYIEEKGSYWVEGTNQRFYEVVNGEMIDITSLFFNK